MRPEDREEANEKAFPQSRKPCTRSRSPCIWDWERNIPSWPVLLPVLPIFVQGMGCRGVRVRDLFFILFGAQGSARLKIGSGGSSKSSLRWFNSKQNNQVCFLLYFSNLSHLAASPFQSCPTAWLPQREDVPFTLDLSFLPPWVPAFIRKYPCHVPGL